MKFKLSEDHPTQHIVILVLGGVFTFLNLLDTFKSSSNDTTQLPISYTYTSVDEHTGEVTEIVSKRKNPEMSWYEKFFCRGYQRSTRCSYRLLHPFKAEWDDAGIEVDELPPEKDHVVRYRGPIEKNTALSSHIEVPD